MKKVFHLFLWILLMLYSCIVLHLLLFGRGVITDASGWEHIATTSNFIPFKTVSLQIRQYLAGEDRGFALRNLGGNFFLLFPIGFLLPCLWKNANRLWKIALGMTAFILIAELLQALLCIGFFDIDDLIFNVIGGVCGYALLKILSLLSSWFRKKRAAGRTNR